MIDTATQESGASGERAGPQWQPLAKLPVFGAVAASGIVLSVFSAGYGYHRDELYFRMLHPAWGYVDQPPLTPLLARGFAAVLGDHAWAVRIPATLATMTAVVIVALITAEFGGGRRAQALSAWAFAFAALPVIMGHALLTSTVDLPVWPAVVLFAMRAVLRDRSQWWLAVGAVVGISTYNKLLVVALLAALVVGIIAAGPRRLLWSRWLLAATVLAVVLALPNLVYQAANGWPQLRMGRALADNNAGEVRISMWPFLLVELGPPLVPIWIAGLVALWRTKRLRWIAVGFPVLLVIVFLMGAQFYYPFGLLAAVFAVGCVPTWRWVSTRPGWRRLLLVGVGLNAAVSLVLGLPLVPVTSLHDTPVAAINQVVRDSVGWPTYVQEIAAVYSTVPPAARSAAIVFATNYGEAGAVDRYGARYHLPPAYSGQNELGQLHRPPDSATTVVFVGAEYDRAELNFRSCVVRGHLDNKLDVDNEEQDQPIAVCGAPIGGWARVWPRMRHLD